VDDAMLRCELDGVRQQDVDVNEQAIRARPG
jgi:hypothetical protein